MAARIAVKPDDTNWKLSPAVPGLLLDVPHEGRWRQRPSLRIEVARHRLLRVTSGGQPLLWLHIDDWWDFCGFLRGPAPAPWRLPPITSAEVREVSHAPATVEWWTSWAHRFVREMEQAEASLPHSGRWCLRPLTPVPANKAASYPSIPATGSGGEVDPPHSLQDALRFEPFWVEPWDWCMPDCNEVRSGAVLSLRAPSAPDDGRVKAWRKHARGGTLPPVLLLYFQLAGKWLVVDGHDRLHAALLEGMAPPLLGLWPVREQVLPENLPWREAALRGAEAALEARITPTRVGSANEQLLRSHETHRRMAITRAWLLAGGAPAWRREVVEWRERRPFPVKAPDDWEWFSAPPRR